MISIAQLGPIMHAADVCDAQNNCYTRYCRCTFVRSTFFTSSAESSSLIWPPVHSTVSMRNKSPSLTLPTWKTHVDPQSHTLAFLPLKSPPMISNHTPLVYIFTYWWNVRMPSVVQFGRRLVFSRFLGVNSHDWNWRAWRHLHQS